MDNRRLYRYIEVLYSNRIVAKPLALTEGTCNLIKVNIPLRGIMMRGGGIAHLLVMNI